MQLLTKLPEKCCKAGKHFNTKKRWFSKHAKFILTKRIQNIKTISTETLKNKTERKKTFRLRG